MKEQLLALIREAELLRAQAIVDGLPGRSEWFLRRALDELYWSYQELTMHD